MILVDYAEEMIFIIITYRDLAFAEMYEITLYIPDLFHGNDKGTVDSYKSSRGSLSSFTRLIGTISNAIQIKLCKLIVNGFELTKERMFMII